MFKTYFENLKAAPQITIDMKEYPGRLKEAIDDLVFSNQERNRKQAAFQIDFKKIETLLKTLSYPYADRLLVVLASQNVEKITAMQNHFQNWYRTTENRMNNWRLESEINHAIYGYKSKLMGPYHFDGEQALSMVDNLVHSTTTNMERIKNNIENAIERLDVWNGTPLKIIPSLPFKTDNQFNWLEAVDDAQVSMPVGTEHPSFTYFIHDHMIEIEDVLEAADHDFFTNPRVEQDYFNLVKELQHPYSTSKQVKMVTVYTARPVKDRAIYEKASTDTAMGQVATVPPGLFVTSDAYSAGGLAIDLAGSEKNRDVWKLKLLSKYLIKTLDSPTEKQYQIIGTEPVPIKWIELYQPGNDEK